MPAGDPRPVERQGIGEEEQSSLDGARIGEEQGSLAGIAEDRSELELELPDHALGTGAPSPGVAERSAESWRHGPRRR